MLGQQSQPINHVRIATPSPAPLHIHLCEVRMESEPTLLQVQHILYPLQHNVCIGTTTIKGHAHPMEHPPQLQAHL